MKRILATILALMLATPAMASFDNRRILNQLRHHETLEQIAADTDAAVNAMVRLGVWQLRRLGHKDIADTLEAQHEMWIGYLTTVEDLGDHDPYSVWLSVVYEVLRYYLGDELMQFLHLDDLYILNFGIVVVFNPKIAFDLEDYLEHWTPFWGVVAYWSIWIGCEVGTWGTGWFLICTPAGMAGEYVTVKWIAPPIGKRVYERYINPNRME